MVVSPYAVSGTEIAYGATPLRMLLAVLRYGMLLRPGEIPTFPMSPPIAQTMVCSYAHALCTSPMHTPYAHAHPMHTHAPRTRPDLGLRYALRTRPTHTPYAHVLVGPTHTVLSPERSWVVPKAYRMPGTDLRSTARYRPTRMAGTDAAYAATRRRRMP
eukprot:2845357-Rhodomonas_salina.1